MSQPQTPEDLATHLQDAVNALHLSSCAFDNGFTGEAKRLAATIRVLLHDTGSSKSLLGQLGQKNGIRYFATPSPYSKGNLLTECPLVAMRMSNTSVEYVPILDDFPPIFSWSEESFEDWWNAAIFRDNQMRHVSRRDLVLALANKDGGSHVDPKLTPIYANLSRNNSMGWRITADGTESDPTEGPHLACMRQIAHELLKSLKKHCGISPKQ